MKEIVGFYSAVGNFETYVGDIMIINTDMILPIYNSQIENHPLNEISNKIDHLDYCYYVFRNVESSIREVYGSSKNSFVQVDYLSTQFNAEKKNEFLLELLDYKSDYQFWNWIIKGDSFSIIVDYDFKIREKPFLKEKMNVSFFNRNHYEALKDILKRN